MAVTLIATMELKDKDALARYRECAGEALARHQGSVSAAGPVTQTLEGPTSTSNTAAILSFPSEEAARAWIGDPALADVHALRNAAGISQIIMLG